MKKLLALTALFVSVGIAHGATILDVQASAVTGTGFANHYGNNWGNSGWNPAPVLLDLTTPVIAKNATRSGTTYGAPSVYVAISREAGSDDGKFRGGGFGVSNQGGSGWRVRLNNNGTDSSNAPSGWAEGTSFAALNFFKLNEGDGTAATFNADNDTLYVEGRVSTASRADDSSWRFVVQDNGNFYISDEYLSPDTTPEFSHSVEALDVQWYDYNPTVAPVSNGFVTVGSAATPDFDNITGLGVHQQFKDGADNLGYNHGFRSFTASGVINGSDAPWAATNSVSWSNTDNATNTGSYYQNAGFNFGTTPANGTNYTSPDVVEGITAGTPIYGASYGSARYITNSVNFGAAFDWGVYPNNNGGARLRLNKPDGGIASGTNVHSGVTAGYNLFMFPLEGFTENDADISIQTWSNQGPGGQNMSDGEIRFVVAKNYSGGTNWAISSPITHTVGTNQFQTVNTLTNYQALSWYNYAPANSWGVGSVGTQVASPMPGDAILAGFRLSASGISTNNSQASVFGARSFSLTGRAWNEYDNDNLVVDADPQTSWNETGNNGVQFELGSFAFSDDIPIVQESAIIGDGLGNDFNGQKETNWWTGAAVYGGFVADGAYSPPVQGYDYASNLESNYNSAALSVAGTSGGDGFKIQWNGPWQSNVGSIPELDYTNGRYEAGDKATALFVWKSDDFLGGSDGSTYEMTAANDVIKATVSYEDRDVVLGSGNVRFVIKENDQYYISYVVSNFTDEASNIELVRQGTTTAWFPYDPVTDVASVDTSTNATQAALDLTDVQAFGVWLEATVATNTGYRLYPRIGVDRFQAGAIVNTPTASSIKQAWLDAYGSGMSGATADGDDPDGDGVVNIFEYAFGGDPTDDTSTGNQPAHGVVAGDGGASILEVIYYERTDASSRGLSTSLKETANLVFDDFTNATVTVVGTGSGPSGFNAVTNHVPVDDDEKFIRVDVNYSAE